LARSIVILGSTGSVGVSTLDLLAQARALGSAAVAAFLDRRIGFLDIAATVAETLDRMERSGDLRAGANANGALETAMAADRSARHVANDVLAELQPSL
jgi:1-deoxy-D-xylulose-5-phosphate reductoisomerase